MSEYLENIFGKIKRTWKGLDKVTRFLIRAAFLIAVVAIIDFYDLGLARALPWVHRLSWFDRDDVEGLVTLLVGLPLFITLWESLRSNYQSRKQTQLESRPYLRAAWVPEQVRNNRIEQGIKNTCLQLCKEGKGLMRDVHYNILVDGRRVEVRRHTVIATDSCTYVVYKNLDSTELLGNPEKGSAENHEFITNKKIVIWGTYTDANENYRYSFLIESDAGQQSWFSESKPQRQVTD